MASIYFEMIEVQPAQYQAENGYTMQREDGRGPNGEYFGGHWVLRNQLGELVEYGQFRNDLFQHPELKRKK